jgi:hypothetical protein
MPKYLVLFLLCTALFGCSIANKTGGLSQAKELHATGVVAQAKILEIADTHWTVNEDPVILFVLEVHRERQEPYEARTRIVISRIKVPQFQPGAIVPIRIDPKDHNRVSLDIYQF